MAIHDHGLHAIDGGDQPPSPHHYDDWVLTDDCSISRATRQLLEVEVQLQLASRDLWIAGWTPTALLDEVRRRVGLTDARSLMTLAILADDAGRSDQARTPDWNAEITLLRAVTDAEPDGPGWSLRWAMASDNSSAAMRLLLDILDELDDLRIVGVP